MSFNNISGVEHASNQEYVHRVNVEKGWFDKPVGFIEAFGLLVTEIAELHEAYESEGLIGGWLLRDQAQSEMADIYIRLADISSRFALNLGVVVDLYQFSYEHDNAKSFDGTCMNLVRRVRTIIEAYRVHGLDDTGVIEHNDIAKAIAHLFLQIQDTCDAYGVDLMKAFDRKMAVNSQREYRHGNKVA